MVAALEDSTAAAAHRQVQDMLNNAITDPDKFRNLSLRTKASHVGKNNDGILTLSTKKIIHVPVCIPSIIYIVNTTYFGISCLYSKDHVLYLTLISLQFPRNFSRLPNVLYSTVPLLTLVRLLEHPN